MPWRFVAMKDVVNCEKPWGVVNRRRARDVRIGEPAGRHGPASRPEMSRDGKRTWGTEPSQYLEEKKSSEIPGVAASERGRVQTRSAYEGVSAADVGLWGMSGDEHERPGATVGGGETPWNGRP
jgi:hypothetical protein